MKLVICGDMSVTDESRELFDTADSEKAFNDAVGIFQSADRCIVNLECALTESDKEIKKFGPCLKGPASTAETLKKAGVTECALSNNHIFDFGKKGLSDTIYVLDEVGLAWFGVGENYEESRKA